MYYAYHKDASIVSRFCNVKLSNWKSGGEYAYFHESKLHENVRKLLE